jgi:hypothetical protein
VWVLGYDQRLRTESDVFVQPIFSAHRCGSGSWSRSGIGSRHRGVANRDDLPRFIVRPPDRAGL